MTRESLTARTSARLFVQPSYFVLASTPSVRSSLLSPRPRYLRRIQVLYPLLGAYVAISELPTDGQSKRPSVVLFICAHTAVVAGNERLGDLTRTLFG